MSGLTNQDFADLPPNQQLAYSEKIANTKEDSLRTPQNTYLHTKTHAQHDTDPYENQTNASPSHPVHVHAESSRAHSFADNVVDGGLQSALDDPAIYGELKESRPNSWEKSRHAGGGTDVESERGKLRVDTFGMADTLNEGEGEVKGGRDLRGRSRA